MIISVDNSSQIWWCHGFHFHQRHFDQAIIPDGDLSVPKYLSLCLTFDPVGHTFLWKFPPPLVLLPLLLGLLSLWISSPLLWAFFPLSLDDPPKFSHQIALHLSVVNLIHSHCFNYYQYTSGSQTSLFSLPLAFEPWTHIYNCLLNIFTSVSSQHINFNIFKLNSLPTTSG